MARIAPSEAPAARSSVAGERAELKVTDESLERSERILAVSRLVLAVSALALILVDPREPLFGSRALYLVVAAYIVYSGTLLWLFPYQSLRDWSVSKPILLADVCWYTLIVALSEGGTSLFFLFYLFAICGAAIHWGVGTTVRIAALSAVLYLTGVMTVRWITLGPDFSLYSAHFMRPAYLMLLGYLVGLLGEHELAAKRRLIEVLAIQRESRNRRSQLYMLSGLLKRVANFFSADYLLLQLRMPHGVGLEWEGRRTPAKRFFFRNVPPAAWLPASAGPLSYRLVHSLGNWGRSVECYGPGNPRPRRLTESEEPSFLARSRMRSLISVPVSVPEGFRGRILVGRVHANFTRDDLDFCNTLVDQGAIILDNLILQEKAEELAIAEERARIARDVHDGFVQSLASLDVGLEVCRKLERKNPTRLSVELEEMQKNVKLGYREARRYLDQLREDSASGPDIDTAVAEVVREFRERDDTRIEFSSEARGIPARNGVGFEVLQIVREGLTNIARHAQADNAKVSVSADSDHFEVVILDDGRGFPVAGEKTNGDLPVSAAPWSIRERVEALSGTLWLKSRAGGGSEIRITLPRQDDP